MRRRTGGWQGKAAINVIGPQHVMANFGGEEALKPLILEAALSISRQITIANKVFSPSVEDVAHARRVIAAMGDGTGAVMIDGKMEDDASVKQCQVMVALADELAAIDPDLKEQYDRIEVADV